MNPKPIILNRLLLPRPKRVWRERPGCRRRVIPIDANTPKGRRRLGYLIAVCRGEQIVHEIAVVRKDRTISWKDASELARAIARERCGEQTVDLLEGDCAIIDLRDCEPLLSVA